MRLGLYPGSFDPFTNGHLDVLTRACAVVDRVVVALGVHPGKAPMLTAERRSETIDAVIRARGLPAEIDTFDGLVTQFALERDATVIFRGVRDGIDLAYEMQMAGMNAALAAGVETVLIPAAPGVGHITGTQVRQIARMGGDVSGFVPGEVLPALKAAAAAKE
jgi:pantetheine-phosphate adenylyltransferase